MQMFQAGGRGMTALLLAASLSAQVPTQAVRLYPSDILRTGCIARDGDLVQVIGVDNLTSPSLRHARSTDGGRTWPGILRTLPQPAQDAILAVAEGRVFVAFRDNIGQWHVMVSLDGGSTWRPPVSLPQSYTRPVIDAHGADVNVFCVGNYVNSQGVQCVHSGDGGVSWSAPTDLAVGLPAGSDANIAIAVDDGDVHVFWNRTSPVLHLVHQGSTDGGANWLPAAQTIANAPLTGAGAGAGHAFVQAGSTLWQSNNHGLTWSPVSGHGLAFPVALAMDGMNMLAVEVVGFGTNQVVRTATSRDAGASWSVTPTTLTGLSSTPPAVVAADSMFVHGSDALWQSDDFGSSWRRIPWASNTAFHAGRDGIDTLTTSTNMPGLWVYVLQAHTRLGVGSPGSGGLVPALAGNGLIGRGRTFSLELSNTLGGTLTACLLDLGMAYRQPIGSSTLYVTPWAVSLMAMTSGPTGQPGAGAATFPLRVPSLGIFAGARLLSQCFVLDAGVPDGFCASAARESWIQ